MHATSVGVSVHRGRGFTASRTLIARRGRSHATPSAASLFQESRDHEEQQLAGHPRVDEGIRVRRDRPSVLTEHAHDGDRPQPIERTESPESRVMQVAVGGIARHAGVIDSVRLDV